MILQGAKDEYEKELKLENFAKACEKSSISLSINYEEEYDHGFYFISSFIEQHFHYHAQFLCDP